VIVVENAWNGEESTTITTTTTITMEKGKDEKISTSEFWLPLSHLSPLSPLLPAT
jgi:hypothetical protein